ncbi:MAG TPA: AlpA family phage regulatory protein [Gammaproteobacteria bacterium]|nr:AlpA family phage regulatory protein [Gammaproteobacteria bacterium]HIL98344.1 AlpA family phage regulatory protein [Pseudomonadales bacterium]
MITHTPIKIVRRPEVLKRFGFGNTCLHSRIKAGLFPPPCQLGGRAVGWLDHELDAVISALAAGESDNEKRELVLQLVNRRMEVAKDMRSLYALTAENS